MIVLNAAELRAVLDMKTCIAAMERAFIDQGHGLYFNPLRTRVRQDEKSPTSMTLMPALRNGDTPRWALKEMTVCPANRQRGEDQLQGAVLLHDGENGRLLAMADVSALTAIRTAAVSGLAARTLSRRGVRSVVILGAGIQARAHVDAMKTVFPEAVLRGWSRDPGKGRAFAESCAIAFEPSLEKAVGEADVVCTVTSATAPFLRREWVKPGCHINAVGSSRPTHVELFPETVAAASLFVDGRQAAVTEAGDIVGAIKADAIGPGHIQAELGEVLAGRHPGRRSDDEITLYKSLGNGAQDLAAVEAAMQAALKTGRGAAVDW